MDRTNCLTIGNLSTQAGEACRAALSTFFGIGQRLLHGFEAESVEAKDETTKMAEEAEVETPGSREVRVWRSTKGLTSQPQLAFEDLSPAGGEQQPESGSSGESSCEVQEMLEPEMQGTLPKEGTASSETEPADTGTGTESDTALPEDVALLEEPYSASEGSERLSTDPAPPVNAVDMGRSLLELLRTGAPKHTDTSAVEEAQLICCGASPEKKTEEADEFSSPLPLPHIAGLSSALWESLVWPLMDPRHPKAFVGHDAFRGCSHMPTGLRPQVLVDERKAYQIMAMFKPSGWATCSTPQWEGLEGNLIRHVWCYFNAPTAAPCHRLDKGTSGIVLVGTNKTASKHICQQILNKGIVKQYVGLCHGMVEPGMGVFSAPLALSRADRPLGACSTAGREAVTRFRVLGYFHGAWGSFSLLQVQIEHGRQHQIRLHMASLGHPIVADARYNSHKAKDDAEICPRLFLHACYLRCTLLAMDSMESEKKEDPFTVACHLPPELRRVLLHELSLDRTSSARLPESARQLCEVLLHPEVSRQEGHGHGNRHSMLRRADMDELHESRLTLRRRDEFMRRFHFNSKERTEIIRILGQLKTSKERSAALQQFRVLGQRTPDFIVGRFAKYVDGLLRWSHCKNGSTEEDDLAPDMCAVCKAKAPPEADAPCAESTSPELRNEMPEVSGPLQILTESVWCEVCGEMEKQVSVQAPSLELRMRLPGINGRRPPCQPVRRRRNTRDFRTTWKVKNSGKRDAEAHEDEELEEDCEEEDDDNDDDEDDAVDDDEEEAEDDDEEEQLEEVSSHRTRRWQPAGYKAKEPAAASDAQAQVQGLQRTVRDLVEGRGGSVDGVWLAGKVAPSFNMYVRENSRRNDGSLKKWLMSIPGIEVDTDTHQSHWRVKLA